MAKQSVRVAFYPGSAQEFRGQMERLRNLSDGHWKSSDGEWSLVFSEHRNERRGLDVTPETRTTWEVFLSPITGKKGHAAIEAYQEAGGKITRLEFWDGYYPAGVWGPAQDRKPIGPAFEEFCQMVIEEALGEASQPPTPVDDLDLKPIFDPMAGVMRMLMSVERGLRKHGYTLTSGAADEGAGEKRGMSIELPIELPEEAALREVTRLLGPGAIAIVPTEREDNWGLTDVLGVEVTRRGTLPQFREFMEDMEQRSRPSLPCYLNTPMHDLKCSQSTACWFITDMPLVEGGKMYGRVLATESPGRIRVTFRMAADLGLQCEVVWFWQTVGDILTGMREEGFTELPVGAEASEPTPAEEGADDDNIRVPQKPQALKRWKVTWRHIKGQWDQEANYKKISEWMTKMHPDLPHSTDTIAAIIRAGEAGLLE